MAKTQSCTVLVTSQVKAAASVVRGTWDLSAKDGGMLTVSIRNGSTAPTAQAVGRILVAHKQASIPAAASEGDGDGDWKQVYELGGGTIAGVQTRTNYTFGPEVAFICVEFPTHTGNNVTVEAIGTDYSY